MIERLFLLGVVFIVPFLASGQEFSSGTTFSEEGSYSPTTLIVNWENDIIVGTDRYYTNGAAITLVNNKLRIRLIDNILNAPFSYKNNRYSIELRQNMYTPEKMFEAEIQIGDRPYAGYFIASYSLETYNKSKKFISSITLGTLGSSAGAGYAQDIIHSFNEMEKATGWQFQVKNAPIINLKYQFDNLLVNTRFISLGYTLRGQLGSLYTDAYAGANLKLGYISSSFGIHEQVSGFESYIYFSTGAMLSVYDATLQGSIINPNPSDYFIQSAEKKYLNSNLSMGFVLSYNKLSIKSQLYFVSPEFIGAKSHGWGSVSIAYTF